MHGISGIRIFWQWQGGMNMAGFMFNNVGLFGSSSSSSGNWMSNLLSLTSDYNSIRNGSYGKLLKAYYGKNSSSTKSTTSKKDDEKTNSVDKEITAAKSDADDLKKSASALTTTGKDSLFVKKEIETKDEKTGETTKTVDYDRKAISSAIKSFVKDYNDMVDSGSETDNTSILQKTLSMIKTTKSNENLLSKVGITIEKGNKLEVNEDKLNEADISSLKTLFNGIGSYGYQIADKAGQISSAALNASLNPSLYTSSASYNQKYYNSIFDYGA